MLPAAALRRVAGVAVCLALLLAAAARVASAETIDRVLAVVSGDLIMLSDVNAARDFGLVAAPSAGDPTGAVLTSLIDRELILAEVDRYAPPEPTAEAVDREFDAVRARFASGEAFEAAMARSGLDATRLREWLREDLRIRAYLDQRFTVQPPTRDDLERYYRDHPEAFTQAGGRQPFEPARPQIVERVVAQRRAALVDEWVAGLRRRADIIDLYLPGR